MNAPQTNKQGFTIIEVVLVLAIAALIFLMVFIALPALQRGQRDTARKNDASTVAAAVNTYKSNHRGTVSDIDTTAIRGYVTELNQYDPDPNLTVNTTRPATATVDEGNITVFRQTKCGAVPAVGANHPLINTAASIRNAAIVIILENSGSSTGWQAYCVDV